MEFKVASGAKTVIHRFGQVAIVGRPNVGKSSLLNRLVGQKISITAPKPQTTRHRITGIFTEPRGQIVFVDTPGIHQGGSDALNRQLNRTARSGFDGVDLVLFVVQSGRFNEEDAGVLELIRQSGLPTILLINKIDLLSDKTALFPFLAQMQARFDFLALYPLSAHRDRGFGGLLDLIFKHLPQGEPMYDPDEVTTITTRFMAAEIIREKMARLLHDELPYKTTVLIERFSEEPDLTEIDAVIYVARDSQKGIVIGSGGKKLKDIGSLARHDLEQMLQTKVMLRLWVRVREDWADDERAVQSLGYQLPE
ncbi:GTPase Era [Halothiobacillus sp.]|uniref:GTPase Era n=1 Tax=Halothiobacillus sp. TaxID=1891311 RepID=UPI0026122AD5|nr:GTPase Era [Halothiobacillus sp.]